MNKIGTGSKKISMSFQMIYQLFSADVIKLKRPSFSSMHEVSETILGYRFSVGNELEPNLRPYFWSYRVRPRS